MGITTSGGFVVGYSQPDDDGNEDLLVQPFNSSGVATDDPITVATIDTSATRSTTLR